MDWQKLLFGEEGAGFLPEVVFRTLIMFLVAIVAMRMSGKRGVRQLSVFEVVMIIALGSAAGDPMLYREVGVVNAILVFMVIVVVYRVIIFFISRSEKIEDLFEGKPVYVIRDSIMVPDEGTMKEIGIDEFFSALREQQVEHLGQVKMAILESSGALSILFREDEDVVHGLPVWPDLYSRKSKSFSHAGTYACACCGYTKVFEISSAATTCPTCRKCDEWVEAINTKRV